LGAAPLAQPHPSPHQRPLVMDEGGGGWFEHRHIPDAPTTGPRVGQLVY
jgi:hypothetical protein